MDKRKLQELAGIAERVDRFELSSQIDPNEGRRTYALGAIVNNVAKGHLGKPQAMQQMMDQGYTEEEARRVFGDY